MARTPGTPSAPAAPFVDMDKVKRALWEAHDHLKSLGMLAHPLDVPEREPVLLTAIDARVYVDSAGNSLFGETWIADGLGLTAGAGSFLTENARHYALASAHTAYSYTFAAVRVAGTAEAKAMRDIAVEHGGNALTRLAFAIREMGGTVGTGFPVPDAERT